MNGTVGCRWALRKRGAEGREGGQGGGEGGGGGWEGGGGLLDWWIIWKTHCPPTEGVSKRRVTLSLYDTYDMIFVNMNGSILISKGYTYRWGLWL